MTSFLLPPRDDILAVTLHRQASHTSHPLGASLSQSLNGAPFLW